MGLLRSLFKKVVGVHEVFSSTQVYFTFNQVKKKFEVDIDADGHPISDRIVTYIHVSESDKAIRLFYGEDLVRLENQQDNTSTNRKEVFLKYFNNPTELLLISQKGVSGNEKAYIVESINRAPGKIVLDGKKMLYYTQWDAYLGMYRKLKLYE